MVRLSIMAHAFTKELHLVNILFRSYFELANIFYYKLKILQKNDRKRKYL